MHFPRHVGLAQRFRVRVRRTRVAAGRPRVSACLRCALRRRHPEFECDWPQVRIVEDACRVVRNPFDRESARFEACLSPVAEGLTDGPPLDYELNLAITGEMLSIGLRLSSRRRGASRRGGLCTDMDPRSTISGNSGRTLRAVSFRAIGTGPASRFRQIGAGIHVPHTAALNHPGHDCQYCFPFPSTRCPISIVGRCCSGRSVDLIVVSLGFSRSPQCAVVVADGIFNDSFAFRGIGRVC